METTRLAAASARTTDQPAGEPPRAQRTALWADGALGTMTFVAYLHS